MSFDLLTFPDGLAIDYGDGPEVHYGAILTVGSQGFVDVEVYSEPGKAESEWERIISEIEEDAEEFDEFGY